MTADERLAKLIEKLEEFGPQLPRRWDRSRPVEIWLDYDELLRELRLVQLGRSVSDEISLEPLNRGGVE